ncbi:MAG: NAD(P)-dependent oxidoreductase [Anaeromyxobacter sp.]
MPRLALLTGSHGAVLEAVELELERSGWRVHHVPGGADGRLHQEVDTRDAEAVVHLGLRSPRELDEPLRAAAEASAASAAAQLARRAGVRRLVHVSTAAVYGAPRNLPCREGEQKLPRTALERIRWRAEQASWAEFRQGAPLTVLRPSILYGPTLRGGPARALSFVTLFNDRRRRIPIVRRGPVAHLLHLEDLARAVRHVLDHPRDDEVVGRAFNVADDAPLPLGEHLAAALEALGYLPGRILPTLPRLWAVGLWLIRNVPDRALLDRLNGRLSHHWRRLSSRAGVAPVLLPKVDREALHWMSADHYYDTSRLSSLGWRPRYPVTVDAFPETIRALVEAGILPGPSGGTPAPTALEG